MARREFGKTSWRHWLALGPRVPSVILLLLIGAAIGGIVVTLLSTFEAERELRAQVAMTSDSLADLRGVQRAMTDAEAGQRGYILTGDTRYLTSYEQGVGDAMPTLNRLEERLRPLADDEMRSELDLLRRAVTSKLRELEIGAELVRQGQRSDAERWVDTHTGYELMSEIRRVVTSIEAHEEELLTADLVAVERAQARTGPIVIMLSVLVAIFVVIGLWGGMRALKAERAARRSEAHRAAREQADLLARELNHRVKNIFAVVQAVVGSTLRNETDTAIAAQKVGERVQALAIAHEVSQGALERPIVELSALLKATLAPYDDFGRALKLEGAEIELPGQMVTPLGLIIHELATNAIKYGAWSGADGGEVTVRWSVEGDAAGERQLDLRWAEKGGPPVTPPEGSGFGSRMIDMSVRQLGAECDRQWPSEGMHVRLRFPISAPDTLQ